jgi:hypothetical protein
VRMRLIALVIVAAIMSLGGVIGCGETLSTIETGFSRPAVSVAETVGIADSPQAIVSPMIRVMETVGVTEFPLINSSPMIRVVETVRVDDSSRVTSPLVVRVMETVVVTDAPRVLSSAAIKVSETISLTDIPTLAPRPVMKVTVMVSSPKIGEVLRVGNTQNVAWTTTGENIAYVDVYYSIDGGKSMITIAKNESNDGFYTWQVPNTPSKTVLVRVLAFNANRDTLAFDDSGLCIISIQ